MFHALRTDTLFMRIKRIDLSNCVFKLSMESLASTSSVTVCMQPRKRSIKSSTLSFRNVVTFLDVSRFYFITRDTMS